MATQAGIGVLIGLGIGSGLTAFLMQRIIRRQDNALQQSLDRLNRMREDHTQDLNAALAKMTADYEQQLAAKIERYQDTHEEQLSELEAEYEARIAALTNINSEEGSQDVEGLPTLNVSESAYDAPQPLVENAFTPIPDPWAETGSKSVTAPAPDAAATTSPPVEPPPVTTPPIPSRSNVSSNRELTQTANELGKVAAINRKEAVRAIPQLGKLIKDSDAEVRLAAVEALQASGSIKAIPFLRQALRDNDSRIVAAASNALSRFKGAKKVKSKTKKNLKKRRYR